MAVEEFAGPVGDSTLGESDHHLISEAIPHMVWLAGPDGYRDYFNRRTVDFTGMPISALTGRGWLRAVHPDDRAATERRWLDAIRHPSPLIAEVRLRRYDGEFRRIVARVMPIKDTKGVVIRWVGTWTDIENERRLVDEVRDAQRRAAEELATTEALMDASPVVYALVDRTYRLIRMNQRMADFLGVDPDDVGHAMADLLPDLWPLAEPRYRQVLDTKEPIRDIEVTRPDPVRGTTHALVSYFPVVVAGSAIGVGVASLDITERVRLQEFHSTLLNNMNEGLFSLDADGKVTMLNRAGERLLGWSASEAIGKSAHDLWHTLCGDGSNRIEDVCELTRTNRGGVRIRVDDVFTRKDGVLLPVSYSTSLLNELAQGGTVVVFHDATEETAARGQAQRAIDTLTWVGRIRDAMEEDRMVLYSQPIVPLQRNGGAAEELLIRMRSKSGDLVLPGTFLPVAEQYGLIADIDRWVIHEAVKVAAQGRRVEANISAWTIANVDIVPDVEVALAEAGADPENLILEITETAFMSNIERGEAFARAVSRLGCHLALDDFGTGFGGFTYLKRLPITYLKIDIEFVRDLLVQPANRRVIEAIVALASGLDKITIAEGVEDEATLELLRDLGVDLAQGYHLGKPALLR